MQLIEYTRIRECLSGYPAALADAIALELEPSMFTAEALASLALHAAARALVEIRPDEPGGLYDTFRHKNACYLLGYCDAKTERLMREWLSCHPELLATMRPRVWSIGSSLNALFTIFKSQAI
jgi:hypothetical protein